MDKQIVKDSDNDNLVNEVHKMAQIALGKQIDMKCTKWAIDEGFFDNFVALYKAGYKRASKIIECKDCQYQYYCERTYLGGCTDGKEWNDDVED